MCALATSLRSPDSWRSAQCTPVWWDRQRVRARRIHEGTVGRQTRAACTSVRCVSVLAPRRLRSPATTHEYCTVRGLAIEIGVWRPARWIRSQPISVVAIRE